MVPAAASITRRIELARAVFAQWPESAKGSHMSSCTGGEPLLQLDKAADRGAA
jgi:organic radical activating enzyme